jgi:hypothetical protein
MVSQSTAINLTGPKHTTDPKMTQTRTVTFTNVQDNVERTVEFPNINQAMIFVQSLHIAGVSAIVNLLPEDVA